MKGIKLQGSLTLAVSWIIAHATGPTLALGQEPPQLQMEIPCINATDPNAVKRLKMKSRHAGQRVCKEVRSEVLQKLHDRVQQQADCYYKGWQLDPMAPATGGECPGKPIPKETCNILSNGVPGTFNNDTNEQTKNHFGSSCGDWPYFNARLSGRVCGITPDYTRTTHFIEDSYNRGAWIQSLNCYHNQVKLEIERYGIVKISRIKLPDGSQQDGPCSVLQKEYMDALTKTDGTSASMSQDVAKRFGGEENLGDVENCTGNEKSDAKELNPDVGRLRQSACHLVAARRALEAMFMQVAACEVWTRAGQSYERFIGGTLTKDGIKEQTRAAISGIRSRDRSACSHNAVLQNWYKPRYYQAFQSRANGIWNAESCGDTGPGVPVSE